DGRRDAAAVLEQLVEGRVGRAFEIHRHAVNHVVERGPRQVEAADERLKAPALFGRRRPAVIAARELTAPERHARVSGRARARRLRRFVYRIVAGWAEVPDGDDRAAPFGGE